MFIYKITNKLNDKIYIGLTTKDVNTRFKQHFKIANNIDHYKDNKKAYPLHFAMSKYGVNNFSIEVIEKCQSMEELNLKEIYWINKLNVTNPDIGYNLCKGGGGVLHTDDIKKRKSKSMRKARDEGRLPGSKLTKEQALEIKNKIMSKKYTNREIAKEYNVSFGLISSIQKNKIFKDVLNDTPILEHGKDGWYNTGYKNRKGSSNNYSKFSDSQVKDIIARYEKGEKINDIASSYNVWRQTISRIIHGKSYYKSIVNIRKNGLSDEEVIKIKKYIIKNLDKTNKEISEIFNISIYQVSKIALNKTYKRLLKDTPVVDKDYKKS